MKRSVDRAAMIMVYHSMTAINAGNLTSYTPDVY